MKHNTLLRTTCLFLVLFCVVSCEKKEGVVKEEGVGTDDLIVGAWQLTDYMLEGEVTRDEDERILDIKAEGGDDMKDLFITFHEDGTTSYSGVGFTLAYTVTERGNPIAETEEMRIQSPVLNGTWERVGEKLIVTYPDYGLDPLEIDIVSLSENEVHLAADGI